PQPEPANSLLPDAHGIPGELGVRWLALVKATQRSTARARFGTVGLYPLGRSSFIQSFRRSSAATRTSWETLSPPHNSNEIKQPYGRRIPYHDKGARCSGIREKVRVLHLATTFDPP
ncbi:MAG: hypothetical protein Q9212_004863, partial [Teloschistes hypoglaucus]